MRCLYGLKTFMGMNPETTSGMTYVRFWMQFGNCLRFVAVPEHPKEPMHVGALLFLRTGQDDGVYRSMCRSPPWTT